MQLRECLPAMTLGILVVATIVGGRLFPSGDRPVLVRLGSSGLAGLLDAPKLADVMLVNVPATGFAVLRGDPALIRSVFGLAVAWQGIAPCTRRS